MSINLTDEIEVKTKKGKLGAAKQIFLEGDTQTVEKEIQDINSRHNSLNTKHESLSKTVQGIAATGGASTATNVTYNNDASGLNAENAQDAIDEVSSIGHFAKRGGIVNISTNYNSDHIAEVLTLSQALSKVPNTDRVLGFQGKYLASDSWHTIIYIGDSLTSWSDTTKWIDFSNKILKSISKNATFAGIANPTTNPGTPDGPVFYIATEVGAYSNFGGIELERGEAAILLWDNGAWTKKITGFATQEELASNKTEVDGKIEEITAKIESSYLDITDNYEFSNGKILSLRGARPGNIFNGNYSASDNNFKHLILDTQEGEEFYISGYSADYYNIATFIDTTTNIVKDADFKDTGFDFIQKIVTPKGANQVVFIFYIANNTPFGIYKKMGDDNLEGGVWYDLNYQTSAIGGYFTLTPKDSTSNLLYFTTNQQVAIKSNATSAFRYINLSVKEGEIYRMHIDKEKVLNYIPILYVILDDNDTIVDIRLKSTGYRLDYIKIPANGTKLIVNLTNFSIAQSVGARQTSYIQKYEKGNITGTEISNQIVKGRIDAIQVGKVGDVLPNLTITGFSGAVCILAECSAGDNIYCNIHNQSSNDYTLAFISHDNVLLYKREDNTTKVMGEVAPEGTKYIYISFLSIGLFNTLIDDIDVYINKNNTLFGYIHDSISNNTFIVPSTFRCIVGQQKVIYYDNLIKGKDDGLRSPSSVACTVGIPSFGEKDMNYDRCWSIPANQVTTKMVGSYNMVLRSFDYKLKIIDKCMKTIKVIPKTGLTSNHNIVIIGDSNIDNSYILKTIYDRFVWLGGVQPTFVGSKTSTFDGDVTIKHEGKSGTTIDYWTGSLSSFWNSETGKLDVSNYRSKNNISGYIDVAVIALGINDCILTGAPNASFIKPLVDAFLEDNPNCKVILELPHLGANTMGGGWMAYPYANRKIFYYNNVLAQRKSYIDYYENTPEYIGKVVIGEGCYCIDRYYGFPNSTKKMSNIIDVQEFVHTNCVHPNRMGYEQEGQDYFVTILDMLQTIEAEN